MILVAMLAAVSAWLVVRKAPQHRPIAWALTACTALDAVRMLGLPARADMALCATQPFVASTAYGLTLRPQTADLFTVRLTCVSWVLVILLAPEPLVWWSWMLPLAHGQTVGLGIVWALARRRYGQHFGVSQRVALILLGGDALAAASLCGREWISHQAGVVLGLVTVYQVMWWWRWRRWERRWL